MIRNFFLYSNMIREIKKYYEELKSTDLKRIKVTSGGDFYMTSEDLFNDKEESTNLIKSLTKSVSNYQKRAKEKTDNQEPPPSSKENA